MLVSVEVDVVGGVYSFNYNGGSYSKRIVLVTREDPSHISGWEFNSNDEQPIFRNFFKSKIHNMKQYHDTKYRIVEFPTTGTIKSATFNNKAYVVNVE